MTLEQALGLYNYWIVIVLMMTGFYIVIARENLIKKIIGLNIFQTSVFLLYITMGKVEGGTAPIIPPHLVPDHHGDSSSHTSSHGHETSHRVLESPAAAGLGPAGTEDPVANGHEHAAHAADIIYSNPLPSVLMLTAIVVGIATTALALALIVRIREQYGTVEEDEILELERAS